MKKMSETIVFFGSGPVAAESLALLVKDFEIEAVVTKPQPAHHKRAFPVVKLAHELGLHVLTTADKRELANLFIDKPPISQLGVVIDYGIIIGQEIIDCFPLGLVNSHFSLLPRWRGADPISFAILEGDVKTGVSLMMIVEKLDEGPLLAQKELPIAPNTATPGLTRQLIDLSYQMLVETLPRYAAGVLKPYPQPGDKPTYSRKLTKEDGQIDWHRPAVMLERQVRAFADWPKSHSRLGSTEVIITQSTVAAEALKPGEISVKNKQLLVGTSEGSLEILSLKPAGKPEMSAEAFLAGYKF